MAEDSNSYRNKLIGIGTWYQHNTPFLRSHNFFYDIRDKEMHTLLELNTQRETNHNFNCQNPTLTQLNSTQLKATLLNLG